MFSWLFSIFVLTGALLVDPGRCNWYCSMDGMIINNIHQNCFSVNLIPQSAKAESWSDYDSVNVYSFLWLSSALYSNYKERKRRKIEGNAGPFAKGKAGLLNCLLCPISATFETLANVKLYMVGTNASYCTMV